MSKHFLETIWYIPFSNRASIYATNGTVEIDLEATVIGYPRLYQITRAD